VAGAIALIALISLFLNADYRPGVVGTLIYFLIGIAYFAVAGRHKLVLSPEEEFALSQGQYGVNLEQEGYGAMSATEIATEDTSTRSPELRGPTFWSRVSTSAHRASRFVLDEGGDVVATGSAAYHGPRARRLGGAGSVHLLHRTSRRRPHGDPTSKTRVVAMGLGSQ
jgi:hypothetical protein